MVKVNVETVEQLLKGESTQVCGCVLDVLNSIGGASNWQRIAIKIETAVRKYLRGTPVEIGNDLRKVVRTLIIEEKTARLIERKVAAEIFRLTQRKPKLTSGGVS
jgi:hypothetical protein